MAYLVQAGTHLPNYLGRWQICLSCRRRYGCRI